MGSLQIGWARRVISIDTPINIVGQFYHRISRGVADPLLAEALVLADEKESVLLCSIDLAVVRYCLLDEVREKTSNLADDIPVDKIILNATHTHTGGDTGGEYDEFFFGSYASSIPPVPNEPPSESPQKYRHWLAGQIAAAIAEAWRNKSPGRMAWGYGYAVVAHSRRSVYFHDVSKTPAFEGGAETRHVHGRCVMYGDTNVPDFSHYEAGADHFVNLLYTFDADGTVTGAVINVPCPSQNSEQEYYLSGDYWSDVRHRIKAKHGDIHILAQSAAAGDLSPRILHYTAAQERRFRLKYGVDTRPETGKKDAKAHCERRDIAERIVAAFDEVLEWAGKDRRDRLPLGHRVATLQLPRRRVSEDLLKKAREEFEKLRVQPWQDTGDAVADRCENTRLTFRRKRWARVIHRFEIQDKNPHVPMELHAVRIGPVALITNRFELFMDYMHRIQARSPFEQTFVIQLTGVPGPAGGTYLATERAVENRGYGASIFENVVSPEGGQILVNESIDLLERLAAEDDRG